MTAATSQKLADVLRAAGFEDLAKRAEADEFHDFKSPHALPTAALVGILAGIIHGSGDERERAAAYNIRMRAIDGEFEASEEESDEWAQSPEGQETFGKLVRGE